MYLTKLIINAQHRDARRDLSNAYEMHRTLSRAFASDGTVLPHRFLWRLERDGGYSLNHQTVLIQSLYLANWQPLQENSGYIEQLYPNKAVDLSHLVGFGRWYRFRLLANPTVYRGGKRYGLMGEADQLAWLQRQGKKNGFSLRDVLVVRDELLQCRQGKKEHRIQLKAVLYEGLLQVTDVTRLQQVLTDGIGRAKSMGLGLLSLAPL
ncbi:type I-E CRISPR-associated protein Cas6/Cse3/CasE [Ectothiorhodospiraceae bacterium BW-2]|nr:type I-E CRISPR-associated protein Cas6/Cse3/CasE [Ectothiorhodospiraceae bacterium BW-2]